MAKPSKSDIVKALMARHGRTYSAEIGIDVAKNTPAPLFQWLVASLLFSARIGAPQAVKASKALFSAGWRTPEKMRDAGWESRVKVLNENGYARYDESTARMLAETCDLLLEKFGGDLRQLRTRAGGDARAAERLFAGFKGIGPTGAAIFLRDVQAPWDEFFPYADRKALKAGEKLGLGGDAGALAGLVPRRKFPVFLTALVRADLAREGEMLAGGRSHAS